MSWRGKDLIIEKVNGLLYPVTYMIDTLIKSAFQNGYLSVESEGLINQVLETKCYRQEDLMALNTLYAAIDAGRIKREAANSSPIRLPELNLTE